MREDRVAHGDPVDERVQPRPTVELIEPQVAVAQTPRAFAKNLRVFHGSLPHVHLRSRARIFRIEREDRGLVLLLEGTQRVERLRERVPTLENRSYVALVRFDVERCLMSEEVVELHRRPAFRAATMAS